MISFLHPSAWVLFFFGAINSVAFLAMLWDKARSRQQGGERISEGLLFFLASMFGSIGVYVGMFSLRHKTRKWYFLIGIPALILEQIALLYFISLSL